MTLAASPRVALAAVTLAVLLAAVPAARAGWPTDPASDLPVCTAPGVQITPVTCTDGAGGAIVAWPDQRDGAGAVFVQRVSAAGVALWTLDGVRVSAPGFHADIPVLVPDGAGGAIVVWDEIHLGTWRVYAQRLDAAGTPLWGTAGVPLGSEPGDQMWPVAAPDGAGGAIVAWADNRSGPRWIVAQRVNPDGTLAWYSGGIRQCMAGGEQYDCVIAADGAGGAFLAWVDTRAGNADIYAGYVGPDGMPWNVFGFAVCTAPGDQYHADIAANAAGSAYITWMDQRSGTHTDMYVQKAILPGSMEWTPDGVALTTAGENALPIVIADGPDVVVAWTDAPDLPGGDYDIHAQRVDAGGTPLWTAGGVAVSAAEGRQRYVAGIPDGAGGVVLAWMDGRDGREDIYAQRLGSDGSPLWAADGVPLATGPDEKRMHEDAFYPQPRPVVAGGGGGAIVTWRAMTADGGDIRAAQVDLLGRLGGVARDVVAPQAPATCITPAHACVEVPVTVARTGAVPMRGFSVDVELSAGLVVCGAEVEQGDYLSGVGPTHFEVVDRGGGAYTVDCAILGLPCGATAASGTLFTLHLASALPAGTGTVTVSAVTLRDCANAEIAAAPGAPVTVTVDNLVPGAVSVSASQPRVGNDADGTTRIHVSWTGTVAAGDSVLVYRRGFGAYPEYDDAGGSVPATPGVPPPAGWTWAGTVVAPLAELEDEPPARDFWYHAAYVKDPCGNLSPVSNRTAGALDYHLGDVTDGTPTGLDNRVTTADVSMLGAHYGASLVTGDPRNVLDVGPTTNGSVLTRPTTDDRVQFEDLMMFAINHEQVSAPMAAAAPVPQRDDAVTLAVPDAVVAGERFEAVLGMQASGRVQGVTARLAWDARVCRPVGIAPGAMLVAQDGLALSAGPGQVDAVVLGRGRALAGSGVLASVAFVAHSTGRPGVSIASVEARDRDNRVVALGAPAGVAPVLTRLAPVRPNPFDREAVVSFTLARRAEVRLAVFGVDGRRVAVLAGGIREAGAHQVGWDGAGARPGLYWVRLWTPEGTHTRAVVFAR
jgi:hypothetical protein